MKKYFLALLAIFKNEETIIKEWIEHYIWQGVEHLYLIDNDSNDNYLNIIQPYIDKNIITLYHMPEKYKQRIHYNNIFNQIKNDIEWLIVCDIDEYFFGLNKNLYNFISENNNSFDYLMCSWNNFGSNGYIQQPENIRKSFTKRFINTNSVAEKGGREKYIIRASSLDDIWVHHFFTRNRNIRKLETNEILLFHYQIMSKEYYQKYKMNKGDVAAEHWNNLRDWKYFQEKDGNEIEDLRLSNLVNNNYN